MKSRFAAAIIVATLAIFVAYAARADDNSWTAASDKWETGSNWSLGVPPTNTQSTILITNDTTKTVTIDATTSGNSPDTLTINDLTVSAPVNSTNTLFLSNAGIGTPLQILDQLTIGDGGVLLITGSAINAANGFSVNGAVTLLDGSVTVANNFAAGTFIDGDDSEMTVSNGTFFTQYMQVGASHGPKRVLRITGGTTELVYDLAIGIFGDGSVCVTGGQLLDPNATIGIGLYSGSVGQLAVSNGTVLAGYIYAGAGSDGGEGTLTISGGTVTINNDLGIAPYSGTTGAAWMSGGQLNVTNGTISVGDGGDGSVTVSNGTVLAQNIRLGSNPNTQSTLMFAGGVGIISSSIVIGDCNAGGSGVLTVNGGDVFVINTAHDATVDVANGQLIVDGGFLWIDRLVMTNSCGLFVRNGGTLVVGDLVLDPNLDADGDGLPNGWEQSHGFDPLNAADGVVGPVNSWTGDSDKWETSGDWSLGVLPFLPQAGIQVANAGVKTVTIDALTSSNFPDSIFIRSLTLTAPSGSINTLMVSDAGTNTPLRLLGGLDVESGGCLLVTNSAVLVGGSFDIGGKVSILGGTLTATNDTTLLGTFTAGELTVSNGTVLAGPMFIGIGSGYSADNQLTVAGGTVCLVSDLNLDSRASVWVTGGQLVVTNGMTDLQAGSQMSVSNGTTLARNVIIQQGTLSLLGGTEIVSSNLLVGDCGSYFGDPFDYPGSTTVNGGSLFVTNASGTAVLEVRSGTFTLNSGTVTVDQLVMTSGCGLFVRNGGTLIVGTLVLDPNLSAVGDGIPNGWKQQYGLDPLDSKLANKDSDGDGMSNLQEYLAGTDPTNAASFFGITAIAREGNDVRVTWTMGSGKTNSLQVTTSAGSGFSNNFTDLFIATDTVGSVTNYLDVGAASQTQRFYRVWLVP